jgi:competence protein ComK
VCEKEGVLKMKKECILNKYIANERTMTIMPMEAIEYGTVVKEVDRTVYVKETPFDIIKENLLIGGSDFDGRRRSITYKLGMQKRLPMPINPPRNIYAFPTHAPRQFHCQWIFTEHIDHIHPVKHNEKFKSAIIFKNGEKIFTEVSPYILETQIIKSWRVRKSMEDRKDIRQ